MLEPLGAFASCPPEHRPAVHRHRSGLDTVTVGDRAILTVPLGRLGTPGSDMTELADGPSWEEATAGGFDPHRRLADMDAEGIDVAVLYPTLGLYFWALEDPGAAVSLSRAYNDWLAGYCAAAPGRLYGAAMVPWQDPAAARAELRRAHGELGLAAVFLRPNPCLGRAIADPVHEPFWDTAEELGVTVGIHEGSATTIDSAGADRRPFNPLVLHAASHPLEQMLACASLIAEGVLDRHPGLQVAFLEAGAGWVPYWLWRLEEQRAGFGGWCPAMALTPAEYFARQCFVSLEVDEPGVAELAARLGAGRLVWGSDYPHHDATFPGAVAALRAGLAPLAPAERRAVLGANALACYRLSPPA